MSSLERNRPRPRRLISTWSLRLTTVSFVLEGQVQPFWLDTSDGEKLFCWHVLPLDVYLEHESELVHGYTAGEIVDGLEGTVGGKVLVGDGESRVVVNFHGVSVPLL